MMKEWIKWWKNESNDERMNQMMKGWMKETLICIYFKN